MSADRGATPAIDVRDLTKHFGGRKVVDKVSLRVERGEIHGFLGPNGSGKTTSIRLMCGLLTPDSGSGTCLGFDILRESAAIKRRVGYMTQKFSFWEDLSIRENLAFTARLYGMNNRKRAVEAAIENLGLAGRAEQLAGSLSGGWKQRLALATCNRATRWDVPFENAGRVSVSKPRTGCCSKNFTALSACVRVMMTWMFPSNSARGNVGILALSYLL